MIALAVERAKVWKSADLTVTVRRRRRMRADWPAADTNRQVRTPDPLPTVRAFIAVDRPVGGGVRGSERRRPQKTDWQPNGPKPRRRWRRIYAQHASSHARTAWVYRSGIGREIRERCFPLPNLRRCVVTIFAQARENRTAYCNSRARPAPFLVSQIDSKLRNITSATLKVCFPCREVRRASMSG